MFGQNGFLSNFWQKSFQASLSSPTFFVIGCIALNKLSQVSNEKLFSLLVQLAITIGSS